MSGINAILDKIRQNAGAQADALVAEAKANAEALVQQKADKDAKEAAILADKAREEAAGLKGRLLSMADLQTRQGDLALKQSYINRAFEEAEKALQGIGENEYLNLVQNLLLGSVETGKEEVVLSPLHKEKTQALIQKISGEKGWNLAVTLDETVAGGFILRSETMEIKNTFEAILKANKEAWTTDVAAILFA